MTNIERIKAAEIALKERGLADIKFSYHDDYPASAEKYISEVADMLEAILRGDHKEALPLGDSVRTPA